MIQESAQIVYRRLDEDDLHGLSPILKLNNAFIAGSYVIHRSMQCQQYEPDIDIWLPYGAFQERAVSTITSFLRNNGYTSTRVLYSTKSKAVQQSINTKTYGRIHQIMEKIIEFTGEGKRKVQILRMNIVGGSTIGQIVKHFDITLVQRWFDGEHVWSTAASKFALENNALIINITSDIIKNQSFLEWTRTLLRLLKYNSRGYEIHASTRHALLTGSVESLKKYYEEKRRPRTNIERTILKWNRTSLQVQWYDNMLPPIITLANALSDQNITTQQSHSITIFIPLAKM